MRLESSLAKLNIVLNCFFLSAFFYFDNTHPCKWLGIKKVELKIEHIQYWTSAREAEESPFCRKLLSLLRIACRHLVKAWSRAEHRQIIAPINLNGSSRPVLYHASCTSCISPPFFRFKRPRPYMRVKKKRVSSMLSPSHVAPKGEQVRHAIYHTRKKKEKYTVPLFSMPCEKTVVAPSRLEIVG